MLSTFSSLFYGSVPQLPEFTPAHADQLRQQAIAPTPPSTILRDFHTLLTFVGDEGVEVHSSHHLLCSEALTKLNSKLSRKLKLEQKRPQQKCYPQINGLYLLLRASGLAAVEAQGKKRVLRLDLAALESWNQLNPTEQYFTLLEAWLIWGNDEILGEPLNLCRRFFDNLGRCLILWQYLPDQGLQLQPADQRELGSCVGLHNLALLEMFGCVTVRSDKTKPGWYVEAIKRSPLGDALIHFLAGWTQQELERLDSHPAQNGNGIPPHSAPQQSMFGNWQAALQPFFPDWQQTLTLPQPEFQAGVYVFKVSLCTIWRRIAIPASASLDDLSGIILKSVDFDENQLYCFAFKNRFGWTFRINHPFLQEGPYTHRYRVGELPLCKGSQLTYLFDFGEQWEFDIKLERIDAPNPDLSQPRILECHGEPPEQYPVWEEEEVGWDSVGA